MKMPWPCSSLVLLSCVAIVIVSLSTMANAHGNSHHSSGGQHHVPIPPLNRCQNGDCLEKARRLVKRGIGCDLSNPFMDCLRKRNYNPQFRLGTLCDPNDPLSECFQGQHEWPIAREEEEKRGIGCDLSNPFMDCLKKRDFDQQEEEKRGIGCDLSNPFMDCLKKRDFNQKEEQAIAREEEEKRGIGCDLSNPFMDCLKKRDFDQQEEKRGIGCDLSNPFMDCL